MTSGVDENAANRTGAAMNANIVRFRARRRRAKCILALGLLLSVRATSSFAGAETTATPQQRRACTPDVYRLCAGEIPNPAAITACLRRKKASLSDACRMVFEQ